MHLSPASITLNLDESTITGHLGDIRLGGDEIEEGRHGVLGIEQALVHVDVDHLGAVLDLVARDRQRGRIVAGGDQLAEARRPRDVGALADIDERDGRREHERLEPGEAQALRRIGRSPRLLAAHGVRDGADMVGRRAAAAADDVDEAGLGEFGEQSRHVFRALVIEAELVGQAGIGIGADQRVGDAGEIGDVGAHLLGAERAIEPDGERRGVPHRDPERLRRLPRQHAPRQVGDGAGHHDRNRAPRASNSSAIA